LARDTYFKFQIVGQFSVPIIIVKIEKDKKTIRCEMWIIEILLNDDGNYSNKKYWFKVNLQKYSRCQIVDEIYRAQNVQSEELQIWTYQLRMTKVFPEIMQS
jgi:hypothetical protein